MPVNAQRRVLQFDSLDQVAEDARQLRASGYHSLGQWNLAQVCGHCANWLSYPMDGFPKPNFFVRGILWLMKVTSGKRLLNKTLKSRSMQAGQPTMPQSVPKQNELDDLEAVEQLGKIIARFENFNGEWNPSPLFGAMDTATLTELNLVHCAHHFSYLIPKQEKLVAGSP